MIDMKNIFKIGLMVAAGLSACHTPVDFAKECSERFPPRTDTVQVTTETVRFDTLKIEGERVAYVTETICPPSDTLFVVESKGFLDCPPSKTITKTIVQHDSIVIRAANVALENKLAGQLEAQNRIVMSLKSDIERKRRTIRHLIIAAVGGWLVALLFTFAAYKIWRHNH
jgi:hypothetical protein